MDCKPWCLPFYPQKHFRWYFVYNMNIFQASILSCILSLIAVSKVNMNKNLQEENKVKILKTLLHLGKSETHKSINPRKLSSCSFSVKENSLEAGVCTNSGACRFQGMDYMYQGGCGGHSEWGSSTISTTMRCSMMVTRARKIKGKCTRSGHCWNAYQIKLFHTECKV